jgi:hypothetical protein
MYSGMNPSRRSMPAVFAAMPEPAAGATPVAGGDLVDADAQADNETARAADNGRKILIEDCMLETRDYPMRVAPAQARNCHGDCIPLVRRSLFGC